MKGESEQVVNGLGVSDTQALDTFYSRSEDPKVATMGLGYTDDILFWWPVVALW